MDTIFALATAQGKAGVAIIRISGPLACDVGAMLAGGPLVARQPVLRTLRGLDGVQLDQALILAFDQGKSFTGEEVVELHLHGSPAVVSSVLRTLGDIDGLRLAEAGEFTRRALENGVLDLTEVEGLADLIDAETEAQRKQALRVMTGDLAIRAGGWRTDLVRAAALLEASIDFADEDVPEDVSHEVLSLLDKVETDLTRDARGVAAAERVRSGFEVAIVGAPNAGKSTLLNSIAGRDAAITSEIAGTTRDVIEVRMDLGGMPVTLLDTAGLRETDDKIEALGVDLARRRARDADMRIFLDDGSGTDAGLFVHGDIVRKAKGDLSADADLSVSGKTGHGVAELLSAVEAELSSRVASVGLATRERHRVAILRAIEGIEEARPLVLAGQVSYDIAAEEIRTAIRALESLIGSVDVENLLDEIFASFCVGK